MRKILKRKSIYALIVSLMLTFLDSVPIYATEGGTEAVGSVILPTVSEEIISVVLPTVGDVSPFDFFIDPQGLIYETDAAKYGGGSVEEGAHLLFHNYSGDGYDFSRYSDELIVTNKSTVPVMVRITARITDLGDIALDQDGDFDGDENPAIYLAVMDDEGNEKPLLEEGEVVIEIEMQKAPSDAYTYHYNAENDTYEYAGADDGDIEFDTYSFGLHGECNADADWQGISVSPKVTVTWEVEPVMPDESKDTNDTDGKVEKETEDIEKEEAEEPSLNDLSEEIISDEDIEEKDAEEINSTDPSDEDKTDEANEKEKNSEQPAEEITENIENYEKESKENSSSQNISVGHEDTGNAESNEIESDTP